MHFCCVLTDLLFLSFEEPSKQVAYFSLLPAEMVTYVSNERLEHFLWQGTRLERFLLAPGMYTGGSVHSVNNASVTQTMALQAFLDLDHGVQSILPLLPIGCLPGARPRQQKQRQGSRS